MKMKLFFLFVYSMPLFIIAQEATPKKVVSVYGMYARNFSTKYKVDSGTNNLIGRKYNTTLGLGCNLDYDLAHHLTFRTGIFSTIHFLGEITLGTTELPPANFSTNFYNVYGGIEYIERVDISIPLKIGIKIKETKKIDFYVFTGPLVSFYFSSTNELVGLTEIGYDNKETDRYRILRDFNSKRSFKSIINGSGPFIEWQFDAEGRYKLPRESAILFGLKAHIGTTNLEKANFTIWPDYVTNRRSKGHYTVNRSYVGIYIGYQFGHKKSKK